MNGSNLNSNLLTIAELAHYGQDHDDPWVRRLAKFTYYSAQYCKERGADPETYFDDLEIKMSDLEDEAANAVRDYEAREDYVNRLQIQINALRQQAEESELKFQLDELRARFYTKNVAFEECKTELSNALKVYEKLQRKYQDLVEKDQLMTILSSE